MTNYLLDTNTVIDYLEGNLPANAFDMVDNTINQTRQQYRIKLPDAVIAATSLVYDLALITHNIADFINVQGLKVIDPYRL